jgi:pilus assembly protein CpaB
MNFSKGTIFMIISGLVGLLAMYTVHRYVTSHTQVAVKPVSHLVVAASDIPPGTLLTKDQVKVVTWPRELIPPKAIANLNGIENRIVDTTVNKGEPILLTKLAPQGTSAGLAGLLGKGKRAVSVRVDDVSGVAGFVHPGDHVDVLADLALPESKGHVSKTILQNIVVLTAGQSWERLSDQKPSIVNTVTLVLTNEQAEILNLASNQGRIRLALRNSNDVVPVATKGVDTASLFGTAPKETPKIVANNHNIPANNRNVEVIKGLERSRVNL